VLLKTEKSEVSLGLAEKSISLDLKLPEAPFGEIHISSLLLS